MKQTSPIISISPSSQEEVDECDAEIEIRKVVVSAEQHGNRLDRALADGVPEFSRSYLQQLIEVGGVTFNGQRATKCALRVKAGDLLAVELRPTPQSQAFKPEAMRLDVVYEDEHLLVVNKPAGLVVHPAPGNWSGTLLNGLLAHNPGAIHVPRAGIVHRLDKDTSGLMVCAKTRAAMDALVQAIAAREVSRQYFALAHGVWSKGGEYAVDLPIGRDPRNRLRMAVVDTQTSPGKPAKTDFVLLAQADSGCWLQCILHTGRTHQIRVHLASLKHALLSDETYGGQAHEGIARQALHAFRLGFVHPQTGQWMTFQVAPPEDMLGVIRTWGLSYNGLLHEKVKNVPCP